LNYDRLSGSNFNTTRGPITYSYKYLNFQGRLHNFQAGLDILFKYSNPAFKIDVLNYLVWFPHVYL